MKIEIINNNSSFKIILFIHMIASVVAYSYGCVGIANVVDHCVHYCSILNLEMSKIVSEYDQEIPQSQTADNPVAPRGRAAQSSRDTRTTN